ncbi:MAG TPA: TRAM domain-containing protein [Anaerolineae bacterium]|nr:TRAM domain-containing protein [Anaerolineae bacterium]
MKNIVLIFRFIGLIVFAILGVYLGNFMVGDLGITVIPLHYAMIGGGFILGLLGFLIMPYISLYPVQTMRNYLSKVSGQTLLLALVGLVIGLIIAALVSLPISLLPPPFGSILPFVVALVFGYLGITIAVTRQSEFKNMAAVFRRSGKGVSTDKRHKWTGGRSILVDTSVIIDGRIADVARTGFLPGTLVVPHFVLNELQYIADSAESLRRQRGRRGMEVLAELQKDRTIDVNLADIDVEGTRDVDEKLVILARQMKAPILTNDFNLNRIAELQGVQVLNINDLANAVKSILLPGETMNVKVIQEGKEPGQGVAYLDDGTMVVVEDGYSFLNKEIAITVTKVLQTAAGRMIFSKPSEKKNKHK